MQESSIYKFFLQDRGVYRLTKNWQNITNRQSREWKTNSKSNTWSKFNLQVTILNYGSFFLRKLRNNNRSFFSNRLTSQIRVQSLKAVLVRLQKIFEPRIAVRVFNQNPQGYGS